MLLRRGEGINSIVKLPEDCHACFMGVTTGSGNKWSGIKWSGIKWSGNKWSDRKLWQTDRPSNQPTDKQPTTRPSHYREFGLKKKKGKIKIYFVVHKHGGHGHRILSEVGRFWFCFDGAWLLSVPPIELIFYKHKTFLINVVVLSRTVWSADVVAAAAHRVVNILIRRSGLSVNLGKKLQGFPKKAPVLKNKKILLIWW